MGNQTNVTTTGQNNAIIVKPGREKPVVQRHPWVFSGAIRSIPTELPNGAIVSVADAKGQWLAYGFLNRNSQIQVRLISWNESDHIDEDFWRARLAHAIGRRRRWRVAEQTNAIRLVNAESDYLPGLVVDQFGDHLVMQIGAMGMDVLKANIAAILQSLTGCRSISERSDAASRKHEGLADANGPLTQHAPPARAEVEEYGLRFLVDMLHGQKTGFYIDQRENRHRVASYCGGANVLNAFSYTGAFAVHALAADAHRVVNIDSSVEALTLAESNLRLNGFDPDTQTENIAGNVFDVLRDADAIDPAGQGFDVVIVDPPKFVHNRGGMDRGLRGYKEINMLALRLLKPDGILATFSCSGLVSADLFQKVVFGAALDTGRDLQMLERLRQSCDHPVALTFPEGEYLTGLICQAA